ncbi:MAG: toll/interleukin-1 receptor domain-containing protein [Magnetococcales bacterium]|nr:toll/interleukin-1 receptor domain-containing protein [Magnetococcales bacterium]
MKNKVFISYLSEDIDNVHRLRDNLESNFINVWLDKKQIRPGQKWEIAIRSAIQNGAFFIACFSSSYFNRPKNYMNQELEWAIRELTQYNDTNIWFIPVIFDDSDLPEFVAGKRLRDLQYIRLYNNWEEGVLSIIETINPLPKDVQRMIDLLEYSSDKIKLEVIDELMRIKNPRSIQYLINCLDNNGVQEKAAEALGKFSDIIAISALADKLNTRDKNFRMVIERGIIDNRSVSVKVLFDLLNSDDDLLKVRSYILLKKINNKKVIENKYLIDRAAKQMICDQGDEIRRFENKIACVGNASDNYDDCLEKKKEYARMVNEYKIAFGNNFDPYPEYKSSIIEHIDDLYIYPVDTTLKCKHTWAVWDSNLMYCTTCQLGT